MTIDLVEKEIAGLEAQIAELPPICYMCETFRDGDFCFQCEIVMERREPLELRIERLKQIVIQMIAQEVSESPNECVT